MKRRKRRVPLCPRAGGVAALNSPLMNSIRLSLIALAAAVALPFPALAQRSYTFGMIAKSQGNPFFEAAHSGAPMIRGGNAI